MTICMDCGEQTSNGNVRCDRCTDKELAAIPTASTDTQRYAEALARLTELYLMSNVEVPRQIAQHPDWSDRQIVRAAIQVVNSFMNDPHRVGLLLSNMRGK